MTASNQNYIHVEVKSKLNTRDACYHAVLNLFVSRPLSKDIKIKIHRNITLPDGF